MEDVQSRTENDLIPWKRKKVIGIFAGFWENIKEIILQPQIFFQKIDLRDSSLFT